MLDSIAGPRCLLNGVDCPSAAEFEPDCARRLWPDGGIAGRFPLHSPAVRLQILQIESIQDLVVIMAGQGGGICGKESVQRSFEQKHTGWNSRHLGVNARIVKSAAAVRGDFYRAAPWSFGVVAHGKPDFPEVRRLASELSEHAYPSFKMRIPCDRSAVRHDLLETIPRQNRFLRS